MIHQTKQQELEQQLFRKALGHYATGVTIVTAMDHQKAMPIGLTVSSFTSVSMEPALVLWCLRSSSRNIDLFQQCQSYHIHVLAADQIELAMKFSTATPQERFQGIDYQIKNNAPLLNQKYISAWFECQPFQRHTAGDHIIFVGQVMHCDTTEKLPLIYHTGRFDLTPQQTIKA